MKLIYYSGNVHKREKNVTGDLYVTKVLFFVGVYLLCALMCDNLRLKSDSCQLIYSREWLHCVYTHTDHAYNSDICHTCTEAPRMISWN